MSLNPAQFRQLYPGFSDPGPDNDFVVQFHIDLAVSLLNAERWGTSLDYATGLFVAHHLALADRDNRTSMAGGIPGSVTGPQTSRSVDKVSVSNDTKAVTFEDAGFWNLTTYGVRLWQLSQMFGAGGIQL